MILSGKNSLSSLFQKPPFAGIIVMIIIVAGLLFDVTKAGSDSDNFYADILRLQKVVTTIHQNYVEDMKSEDLIDDAVTGMLKNLDPHTSYFKPEQFEELKIHTEGKFGGLGIQISIRDKVLTVMTPIAGTPASRAGIQSGDMIITIDGKSTSGITIDKAVNKLRGEPGTKVTITVRRKGEVKDMDYTITRDIINIKSVPFFGVLDSSIGYLTLSTFSQDAGNEVEKALRELLKKNIKGVVFDLRMNPGGLLPQAIDVAEKFLPKNSLVVSTRGRSMGQNNEFKSNKDPVLPSDMPLAILVNYGSASASEIVAGAVQDWDRGIVLGDTTFGKGSVQTVMPLDKTHHLKMTTAFYYTPSGRCINRPENAVKGPTVDTDSGDETDTLSEEAADSIALAKKKDTTTYYTKNGRIVYGGGGIIPDSVVHMEIPNMVVRSLFNKDVFFRFANLEYPKFKKQNRVIDTKFSIDAELLTDFYHFLDSIKFTYQSIAQIRYDEFKRASGLLQDSIALAATQKRADLPGEKPDWSATESAGLKKVSSVIDSLLINESKREVAVNEKEIKKYLLEAFLSRHFGQDNETYFRQRLAEDQQLKIAIYFLRNKNEYMAALKPRVQKSDVSKPVIKK